MQGAMSVEDQREAFDRDWQVAFSAGLRGEIRQIISREWQKDFKSRAKVAKAAERKWETYYRKGKKIHALNKEAPRETRAQEDKVTRAINELRTEMATKIEAILAGSKNKPKNKTPANDSPSRSTAAKAKQAEKKKARATNAIRWGTWPRTANYQLNTSRCWRKSWLSTR